MTLMSDITELMPVVLWPVASPVPPFCFFPSSLSVRLKASFGEALLLTMAVTASPQIEGHIDEMMA